MNKLISRIQVWLRKLRFDLRWQKNIFEDDVADIRMSNENIRHYTFQNLRKEFFSISIKTKDDIFKYLFYFLHIILLVALPYAAINTGISEKEIQQQERAEQLYNFYANHDTAITADAYAQRHTQSVDLFCCCICKWLKINDIYSFRHIIGAFFAWLTILLVGSFLMNMFAWRAAFFGALFMLLSPAFLGQSFGNLADTSFAFFYLMALYQIYLLIGELPIVKWKRLIFIALSIICANSIHVGGYVLVHYLLIFSVLAFVVFNPTSKIFTRRYVQNLGVLILILLGVAATVYIIGIIHPIKGLHFAFLSPRNAIAASCIDYPSAQILWNSKLMSTNDLTSNFILQRLQRTLPLFVIIGCLIHFVFLKTIVKKVRPTNAILLVFSIIYPLWCVFHAKSNIYDGWSIYLMILPLIVMYAVAGYEGILRKVDDKYTNFVIISGIFVLTLMPLRHVLFNYKTMSCYFNELSGGINNAYGHYVIDENEQANKMVAKWAKKYCSNPNDTAVVRIFTNGGTGCDLLFEEQTRFQVSHSALAPADSTQWDYFISFVDRIPPSQLRNKNWECTPSMKQFLLEHRAIAIVVKNEKSPLFRPVCDTIAEQEPADSLILADKDGISK